MIFGSVHGVGMGSKSHISLVKDLAWALQRQETKKVYDPDLSKEERTKAAERASEYRDYIETARMLEMLEGLSRAGR